MRFAPDLVELTSVRSAVDVDLDNPPQLLPPDVVVPALTNRRDELADWVTGQAAGEFLADHEQTIAVNKARHGIRPVAMWDLTSRLLYAALVGRLAPRLPTLVRGGEPWEQFQQLPLEADGDYIVSADLASCYSLIDHTLLADELKLQTGDHETVSAILSLLQEVSGRLYGVPQQSLPSDVLAEAFLDRLERALLRRGLNIWRYNDDFRIACSGWSGVGRALELLDEECRRHGLMLNDSKTITWGRSKYEEHLNHAEELRKSIADEAQIDPSWVETRLYETRADPTPDDAEALTSVRLLERWETVANRGQVPDDKHAEHRAILQLLPSALARLSPEPAFLPITLDITMQMLRYERTLTPPVCRYLASIEDVDELLNAFDQFLHSNPYLNGWQLWWLLQAVGSLEGFSTGESGKNRMEWLRASLGGPNTTPVLVAHAFVTLARHGATSESELLDLYDRSSPLVQPIVVVALALLKVSSNLQKAVTRDSRLNGWIFTWASG